MSLSLSLPWVCMGLFGVVGTIFFVGVHDDVVQSLPYCVAVLHQVFHDVWRECDGVLRAIWSLHNYFSSSTNVLFPVLSCFEPRRRSFVGVPGGGTPKCGVPSVVHCVVETSARESSSSVATGLRREHIFLVSVSVVLGHRARRGGTTWSSNRAPYLDVS